MRILHLLQWHINDIIPRLEDIREQGFDIVQISPLQGTKDDGLEFWKLYQPVNLKIGNIQTGNKQDLEALCRKAKEIHLKICVDIVLRHVATDNFNIKKPHQLVDDQLRQYILDMPLMENESNRYEVTNYSSGMPVLDYENPGYQQLCIRYLDELKECGVDLFRLDQLKHYRLPSEGGTFIQNVMSKYEWYGEAIYCEKELLDQYAIYGMVGTNCFMTDKNKGVFWVLSHDDILTFKIGINLEGDLFCEEYKLLCKNYPNTLFYAKPFCDDWLNKKVREANFS